MTGAAAGAATVVLFLAGALLGADRPPFATGGPEFAAYLQEHRTSVQLSCLLFALAGPCFIWFLSHVATLARAAGPEPARKASAAYGCGVAFTAMFLLDVTALAAATLRPANMARAPELAGALQDFELLAMAMAAPLVSGALVALALVTLRHRAVWPGWVGWLAALAAAVYAMRAATLFTTDGPFAADGAAGLYAPVSALLGWLTVSSVVLVRRSAERH